MRTASKLGLLAMLAVAALAVAAPSAFAQIEPLFHDQNPRLAVAQEVHAASDIACPAVTPGAPPPVPSPTTTAGGCRLHMSGQNIELWTHTSMGVEAKIFSCDWEFDVRVDSAGEGYLSHQEFTNQTLGDCPRRPCGQTSPPTSEGRAFSFYMREFEQQGPNEQATILLCTWSLFDTVDAHCEFKMDITQPTLHKQRLTAHDSEGHGPGYPFCEVGGGGPEGGDIAVINAEAALQTTGEGQAEQKVEIRHL